MAKAFAKAGNPGRFAAVTGLLSLAGANTGTFALFLIMITVVVDVLGRRLSDRSVPGMLESAEVILVLGAFFGLAYAQRTKGHVATSLVVELLPRRAAQWLQSFGLAVLTLYVGCAAALSGARAWDSFKAGEVRFGLIEIPQWPARAAIAAGFALLFLEVLRDLRQAVLAHRSPGRRTGTL